MSITELKELLMVKNVPQDLYSLEGGLPSESYCIEKTEDKWHLYYSERGVKETINYYDTKVNPTTIPNLNRLSAMLMSVDEGEGSELR